MYIVSIKNGTTSTEVHNEYHKLFSGSVVKGINTIDSFTFSALPDNPAFGNLRDFTTLVSVYNTARQRYEFQGRVLYTSPQMSDKGLITQEAICESYLGFLCDSQQAYVSEKDWTVRGLLEHIVNCHNSQMESYKHFQLGQVGVTDPNDNLYVGIQRETTWETIKKKLLDVLGGEICYLDYVEKLGETKSTEIALSKNMKSIVKEKNPSAFITRLIPLGAKIKNSEGNETEDRIDITSVNGGKNYIDDAEAIAEYGLHVGYVEFDDVTEPSNLLSKGQKWLTDNNKVSIKYSITALDLSLIGLDVDDFDVCNTYPIKNALLGIDDLARINKKTIDVCDETKTSIEIGESFKTLSELQREQVASIGRLNTNVAEIIRNYATNQRLDSEITKTVSLIEQTEESIRLSLEGGYVSSDTFDTYKQETIAELELKVGTTDNGQIVSMLNASADDINIKSNRLTIESDNFNLSKDGTVRARAGEVGGYNLEGDGLSCTATDPSNGTVSTIKLQNGKTPSILLSTLNGKNRSNLSSRLLSISEYPGELVGDVKAFGSSRPWCVLYVLDSSYQPVTAYQLYLDHATGTVKFSTANL